MLEGWVSLEGVPIVQLVIAARTWEATIDTGFNGYFEFPELLRNDIESEYQGRAISILAGGIEVEEDSYLALVPFDGELLTASVTFAPVNEILIGTQTLRNHNLLVDFPAGTVKLWRVAATG
jgi:predicted aspartyl protease